MFIPHNAFGSPARSCWRLTLLLGVSLAWSEVPSALGAALYVSLAGSHQAPFGGWSTAATNLTEAVARAGDGDTVWVTNGLYMLTAEVGVSGVVQVRSVNGPQATLVDGQLTNRCFYLKHVGAVVEGFTIQNGGAELGGGVRFGEGGTLRHCVVTRNRATRQGGGGIFVRWQGLVENCHILNNTAEPGDGGGIYCLSGGVVRESVIAGNTARVGGGVVSLFHGGLINCLVISNSAAQGGGVMCSQYATIRNCTVTRNTARAGGGLHAFYGGEVVNSILFGNTAPVGPNYFNLESADSRTEMSYCCTAPLAVGLGNIDLDPGWVDVAGGDFHLSSGSPCVDAGRPDGAPAGDLEGRVRPQDGDGNGEAVPDMGAYEFVP